MIWVALLWAVWVAVTAARVPARPARLDGLGTATAAGSATRPRHGVVASIDRGVTGFGAWLRRLARRTTDAGRARTLGWALVGGGVAALVVVPAGPVVGFAVWARPVLRRRRSARQHIADAVRGLPEVVDLFVVAVGAGLNVNLAVRAVAPRSPPVYAAALGEVVHDIDLGARVADALDRLPARVGEPVRPLTRALVASERYGAPLTTTLDRLSDDVRRDRRRRAEETARRLPVRLLFPLVLCGLPALALLTLAPLVAGALQALRS